MASTRTRRTKQKSDDAPESDKASGARSFWSGTITFGLVSIPVSLYSAYRSIGASLRMLDADGTPLARRYFCSKHKKQVEYEEIVRGYEVEAGKFVVVTDEELEALEPKKSRDIELSRFVDVAAIPPQFFDRAYFLAPSGQSTRAYHLLATTMEQTGKAGIATFVMRAKEHLVAILAEDGVLVAETMRFSDELRTPDTVGLPKADRVGAAAVTKFRKLIQKHTSRKLDTEELRDEYWSRLRALAERKHSKGEGVVTAPVAEVPETPTPSEDEAPTNVVDLMAVLKRRLEGLDAKESAEPARKGVRKASAKKRSTSAAPRAKRKAASHR